MTQKILFSIALLFCTLTLVQAQGPDPRLCEARNGDCFGCINAKDPETGDKVCSFCKWNSTYGNCFLTSQPDLCTRSSKSIIDDLATCKCNGQCTKKEQCLANALSFTCRAKSKDGQPCNADAECLSGECEENECGKTSSVTLMYSIIGVIALITTFSAGIYFIRRKARESYYQQDDELDASEAPRRSERDTSGLAGDLGGQEQQVRTETAADRARRAKTGGDDDMPVLEANEL